MYLDVLQTNETKGFCLFCEHISYNERLQGVLDQLTDFQKQNTKVILQMGMNTILPVFEGYIEPPSPVPQTSEQREMEELTSLPLIIPMRDRTSHFQCPHRMRALVV